MLSPRRLPSTRFWITTLFGFLALVIVLALSFAIGARTQSLIAQDRGQALQDLATSTAASLADHLRERQREIAVLADSDMIRNYAIQPDRATAALERARSRLSHHIWMGIADTGGTVQIGTDGVLLDRDASHQPWFAPGLQAPYIGDLHYAQLLTGLLPPEPNSEPLHFLDFATPIRNADGKTIGVLNARGGWRWAREIALRLFPAERSTEGLEIFIYNNIGELLLTNHGGEPPAALQIFTAGHPLLLPWTDGHFMTVVTRLPHRADSTELDWLIVVRQPEAIALQLAHHARNTTFVAGLIAVAAFMGLAWFLAGCAMRPMRAIVASARRIERGDTASEIPQEHRTRELFNLSEALRGMTSTLLRQKRELAAANLELEAQVAARTQALQQAIAELDALARSDALTGLPNRRAADERLGHELRRSARSRAPLSVLLLDIDHFKQINDRFGHEHGDFALQSIALLLAAKIRATDLAARFGGEEFIVMLPETDASQAKHVAEKLRCAISELELPESGCPTVSIGVATTHGSDNAASLLRAADVALYSAKRNGRNRVEMAPIDMAA